MTRLCRIGALVAAALLLTSSPARGATDYDIYQQLWNKYAAPLRAKPKVACVGMDGTHDYELGALGNGPFVVLGK